MCFYYCNQALLFQGNRHSKNKYRRQSADTNFHLKAIIAVRYLTCLSLQNVNRNYKNDISTILLHIEHTLEYWIMASLLEYGFFVESFLFASSKELARTDRKHVKNGNLNF